MTGERTLNGNLSVQVDGHSPESWSEILGQFGDANIYQTWAYGAVRWGSRNLSHLVIRREGRVLAAAQVRIVRLPLVPAGMAYLRWGPLCQIAGTVLDPALVNKTVFALQEEYVQRRGLTLQVIPCAFSGSDRAAVIQSAFSQSGLRPEPSLGKYQTVLVDLNLPPETIRERFDRKTRRHLNRAEKNGLVLEMSDGPEAYREFVRLYEPMRQRKQFTTSVDVDEFGRIQSLLSGSARMQTFLARKDGNAIGALVCSRMGDTGIYLLGATNARARDLLASYLLHWRAMLWLKEQGARCYDLGGIDPEANPGGYEFKTGFGGNAVTQLETHSCQSGWFSSGVSALINWSRRANGASKLAIPATART